MVEKNKDLKEKMPFIDLLIQMSRMFVMYSRSRVLDEKSYECRGIEQFLSPSRLMSC